MAVLRLGLAADVPSGCVREARAGDRTWAVCNIAGQIRVLSGECPHSNGPLGHGALHGDTLVCPWHGWEFDVATGECSAGADCRVGTYDVMVRDGQIYIGSRRLMPELPEVETIVRELRPRLTGRHILSAEVLHPRIVRFCREDLASVIGGRRIEEVLRQGKFILLRLDRGWITIHLGMTGKIRFDSAPGVHTRAVFALDDCAMLYDDARMFGSIEWSAEPERTSRLGPDAFASGDLPPELLRRRTPIKAALLNQSVFSGIGNIYADEALFRAGIHPKRRADRLSASRAARLTSVVRELMGEAVELRGSSVSDYVDTGGRQGTFQQRHQVYGREGLPCTRCGAVIRRIVLAGRGTHYCPVCQR